MAADTVRHLERTVTGGAVISGDHLDVGRSPHLQRTDAVPARDSSGAGSAPQVTHLQTRVLLIAVLAGACAVRMWYLTVGVPYAVGVDEPAVVDRAFDIVKSGDWNPRGFDYPSLVIYWQALVTIVTFLGGASRGLWASLDGVDITVVYATGRAVAALIGTATVWLTYRIGKDLHSRMLGVVAAAQLAAQPIHVRESHFILTDVPATALVTLTLFLAGRAARRRTVSAYAWAGAAGGLSAAAKYNAGAVVLVVILAWLLCERRASDRARKLAAAIGATFAAFLLTVPYAVLDLPGFLNGLGAQLARFAPRDRSTWFDYLIHLSLGWRFWVPTAVLGILFVLWERRGLKTWAVVIGFVLLYYYVLASHSIVYARYALPLLPGVCLLAAVPVIQLWRAASARLHNGFAPSAVLVTASLVIIGPFTFDSVRWLQNYHRPDTRVIAAQWLIGNVTKGSRLVVENGGPANLNYAGFTVAERPNVLDDEIFESYRKQGIEYFLTAPYSTVDPAPSGPAAHIERVVFAVAPNEHRFGPFVRILKIPPQQ
jgi:4-amino-4-deoxy-L-arabinose transferase-like glycosyltransferase